MTRIFISYRRADTQWAAARIRDYLGNHFGRDRVFMDIDAIDPGENFVQAIEKAVGSSDALVVVIGAEWADVRDEQGRRRLEDENDYVRREVAAALERGVWVIPVLIDAAPMPLADALPDDLKMLAQHNALMVGTTRFDHDVQRLVDAIERNTLSLKKPKPRRQKKPFPLGAALVAVAAVGLLGVAALVGLWAITRGIGDSSTDNVGGAGESAQEPEPTAPPAAAEVEVAPQQPEPTAPPIEEDTATGPTISNIRFCDGPCDAANPVELTAFPEGTQNIHVSWDYAGMQPGMNYTRDWSNRGQSWLHYDCVWQGPENGTEEVELREPGGLRSGTWTMALRVEGEIVATASVELLGSHEYWDPAGTLPCEDF